MNAAVFLPNWVGDAVMATPTLRAFRDALGPDARIVGIMRPHLIELLQGTDWLTESWAFDPRSNDRALRIGTVTRRMRDANFDIGLMLSNSLRCAWMCYRAGVRRRIGYAGNCRTMFLTDRLYWTRTGCGMLPGIGGNRAAIPNVDQYLRLLEPLGCVCPSRKLELQTSRADRQEAEKVWSELNLNADGRVIALSGGGAYGPSKLWPEKNLAELAKMIVERLDHDVLVLCGPKEKDSARRVVQAADSKRVVSMADQRLVWGNVKACIERCRMMVATDSGPRHIGAALGLPVVTLFGPTVTTWIENPTVRGTHLMNESLDCLGCYKRECPLGHHRCMTELKPQTVFEAVAATLDSDSTANQEMH